MTDLFLQFLGISALPLIKQTKPQNKNKSPEKLHTYLAKY